MNLTDARRLADVLLESREPIPRAVGFPSEAEDTAERKRLGLQPALPQPDVQDGHQVGAEEDGR